MRVEGVVKLVIDAPVLVRFPLWLRSCVACVFKPSQNKKPLRSGTASCAGDFIDAAKRPGCDKLSVMMSSASEIAPQRELDMAVVSMHEIARWDDRGVLTYETTIAEHSFDFLA